MAGSFPEATPASVSATYLPDTGTGTASVLGPTANGGHGTDVGAIAGSTYRPSTRRPASGIYYNLEIT